MIEITGDTSRSIGTAEANLYIETLILKTFKEQRLGGRLARRTEGTKKRVGERDREAQRLSQRRREASRGEQRRAEAKRDHGQIP